jgi:hypothetical protein
MIMLKIHDVYIARYARGWITIEKKINHQPNNQILLFWSYYRIIDWVTNQIQSSGHMISKWQRPLRRVDHPDWGRLTQRQPARQQRYSTLNRKQFNRRFGAAGYFRIRIYRGNNSVFVCL